MANKTKQKQNKRCIHGLKNANQTMIRLFAISVKRNYSQEEPPFKSIVLARTIYINQSLLDQTIKLFLFHRLQNCQIKLNRLCSWLWQHVVIIQ